MNETYLHFIWKFKRLPFHQLLTTEGKTIQILKNGTHNFSESGPDFYNARMIYDNMEWAGQIEMHLKSSDWYKHHHHLDDAYNNVMLHVVYEHDKEVFLNNVQLPTIELKPYIDEKHYENWEQFARSVKDIACEDSISTIDSVYVASMLHRTAIERMNRRVKQLTYMYSGTDNPTLLYQLIAKAFGTKVNVVPFECLTNQLPISLLKKWNKNKQKQVVLQTSGLFMDEQNNLEIAPLNPSMWKRKGLRPPAFPEKRLVLFASFIARCDFELLSNLLSPKEAIDYTYQLIEKLNQEEQLHFSKTLVNQLFINAFLPYFWYKSIQTLDDNLQEFIIDFLEKLPPDENYIIQKWKNSGIKPKNAYESQALIELFNEYCTYKKCLNCQIGVKIMRG
ncbi:MAG: DUF2851 family protein [Crocinitomicaceae bacterium]|nr:DUF2851 family protein [Crocinitomicaceae bacterium]